MHPARCESLILFGWVPCVDGLLPIYRRIGAVPDFRSFLDKARTGAVCWNNSEQGEPAISVNRSKNQVISEMRARGLRITPQREAILEYLLTTDEHPTARQVWKAARKRVPGISLSTVYSSLAELSRLRLIKELEFNEMENRYEGNLAQHINLVCTRCGKITDYMTAHTIDMEQVREATQFFAVQSRFELYGICADCAEK